MNINSVEFFKCVLIFIFLYNLESIFSAITNLIVESISYLIGKLQLKLVKYQEELEDHSEDELTPCIGFQAPLPKEEDYD